MLIKTVVFKIFTFVALCLFAQSHSSAVKHLELSALADEMRGTIGPLHKTKKAKRKLRSLDDGQQEEVLKLTRGLCQLLAWSDYRPKKAGRDEIDWEGHNKCLSLIKITEDVPVVDEDRALFFASGAKIRLQKLQFLVARGGIDDSEKVAKLRKIYNLFMQSKKIKNRKACRLAIAKLILDWKFSPTGDLTKDYAIAKRMLPSSKPRDGLVSPVGAGEFAERAALAHLDDSLPNGNLAAFKVEEDRLRVLLATMKDTIDGEQRVPAEEEVVDPADQIAEPTAIAQELVPELSPLLGDGSVPKLALVAEVVPALSLDGSAVVPENDDDDDDLKSRLTGDKRKRIIEDDDLVASESSALSSSMVAGVDSSDEDKVKKAKRRKRGSGKQKKDLL